MTATAASQDAIAKAKTKAEGETTATLCDALTLLAAFPGMPGSDVAQAATREVLCERHPEAKSAAKEWAENSPSFSTTGLDAAIYAAALTAAAQATMGA